MRYPIVCVLSLLSSGCIVAPLKLAPDDSPTVLSQHRLTIADPSRVGTHAVKMLYYGSGNDKQRAIFRDSVTLRTRSVDASKLASAPTPALGRQRTKYWGFDFKKVPLNGRVWYPDGDGPFPLVLVVHGNHNMEEYSDPGYEYLGRLLASRGYILVSVDENFLNGNIRGENDARGWMLLQHVREWHAFNDSTGSPFRGKVDLSRIALMGHSRGGEAVAVAGLFNRLRHYPDDASLTFDFNYNIRSLVAIAPVDGQYRPAEKPTPLVDYNYLLMHGSHDGDVSTFNGLTQYERTTFTGNTSLFKSAVYVYRANHGQWNSVWGSTDGGPRSRRTLDLRGFISEADQRRFAEVYISAFLDATLKGERGYLPLFRDHRVAGNWLPKTMYITRFAECTGKTLADFEEDVDLTTGSIAGVSLRGDSLASWKESMVPFRGRGQNQAHSAVTLSWNNRIAGTDTTRRGMPASYTLTLGDSLRTALSLGEGSALVFSLAPLSNVPAPRAAPKDSTKDSTATARSAGAPRPPRVTVPKDSTPMDLSVELVDEAGVAVKLPLSRYGAVRRPLESYVYRRSGRDKQRFANVYEVVLQTYTIPLRDAVPGSQFNPRRLKSVRWVFDRTVAGSVLLDQIGLSRMGTEFFVPQEDGQ